MCICIFFICILHSVLDWKPCVLLTDWNDEGHATGLLHTSLLSISSSSSVILSILTNNIIMITFITIFIMMEGLSLDGRFIWQARGWPQEAHSTSSSSSSSSSSLSLSSSVIIMTYPWPIHLASKRAATRSCG